MTLDEIEPAPQAHERGDGVRMMCERGETFKLAGALIVHFPAKNLGGVVVLYAGCDNSRDVEDGWHPQGLTNRVHSTHAGEMFDLQNRAESRVRYACREGPAGDATEGRYRECSGFVDVTFLQYTSRHRRRSWEGCIPTQ